MIDITTNAVTRYQEIVKPQLSWKAAQEELRKLVGMGTMRHSIDWVGLDQEGYVFLLELSDGIAATLKHNVCPRCEGAGHGVIGGVDISCPQCFGVGELMTYVVTTVIVRGGMSEDHRRVKSERAAQKRRSRRLRRRKDRHNGRPEEKFDPCYTLLA